MEKNEEKLENDNSQEKNKNNEINRKSFKQLMLEKVEDAKKRVFLSMSAKFGEPFD